MLPGTRYLSYIHIRCLEREELIPVTAPTTYTKCRHSAAASQGILRVARILTEEKERKRSYGLSSTRGAGHPHGHLVQVL